MRRKRKKGRRSLAVAAVIFGVFLLGVLLLAFPSFNPTKQTYGVSFSSKEAESFGLDWKQAYIALLDDAGVRHLRVSAYWDLLEPSDGAYDFSSLDFQLEEASKRGADVVLAVGRKLPRWPECHVPAWASSLPEHEQQEKVLALIARVVERYKGSANLYMWQLENEPLLSFGICPPADEAFLLAEQEVIREHDMLHPILVTDSGELNSWLGASKYGDVLGTTMYRTVFSNRTQKLFHYDYIFPSWMYRLKARYIGILRNKDVLISELQGEPWGIRPIVEMDIEERRASFSPDRFREFALFAERTQLQRAYWWGAEYWYWEKVRHGNSEYWDIAKSLFSSEGGGEYGE